MEREMLTAASVVVSGVVAVAGGVVVAVGISFTIII